jgi:Secretion system C-terminal sorting domain
VIPDSLIVDISISNNNLTVTTTGGTPPYRHSLDGGDVFLGTNVFTELPLGTYNIIVKDDNNCLSTEQIITLTSASDLQEHFITISPNPSDGNFTLISDIILDPNAKVSVVDILGRHINAGTYKSHDSNEMNIDMMGEASGVYLLIITSKDKQWSAKMVKI